MKKEKKAREKRSIKVKDLRAQDDPKGGGKRKASDAKVSDISIMKVVDKSSPNL